MKKILLLTALITTFVFANTKTINASYKVTYGLFGQLGVANTTLSINDNKYKIEVNVYATGFAKVLSSNKNETYISKGTIKDNQLIPTEYIKVSQNDYKKRTKKYSFDYQTNTINVQDQNRKLITTLDMNYEQVSKWKEKNSTYKTKYFTPNDLLSLFFNIKSVVPNFDKGSQYSLHAIGANKKDGEIKIIVPDEKNYSLLEENLSKNDDTKFIAQINQKIFSSSKGELLISLNKNGFCNKAVLKDVLIFGDIIGEMTKFEIKETNES